MLVIKGANIFTAAGEIYDKGDLLIEDGKIAKIGKELKVPQGAEVINAEGLIAIPGIVDAHSHIGGFGYGENASQDVNEMTANATPEVEVLYGIDPQSPHFQRAAAAGITTSAVAPGSGNVIGGMVCAVKSAGESLESRCIKNPVALKMALGGNPKGVYGKRNQMPMTRMGVAQVIRDTFLKAKEYDAKKKKALENGTAAPEFNQGLENVCMVLRHEIPVKVHCEQYDMLTTLAVAKEFDIECTIDHAWGASDYYDDISQSKNLKGIIFGPIGVYLTPGECGKVDIESLVELEKRGVCCAIMTDCPVMPPDLIIHQAGEAVRFGLDPMRAIEMLTINPAKIVGVEDRVGSLEVGKDADVVLFKGMPTVDTAAKVEYTLVNGKIVFKA